MLYSIIKTENGLLYGLVKVLVLYNFSQVKFTPVIQTIHSRVDEQKLKLAGFLKLLNYLTV